MYINPEEQASIAKMQYCELHAFQHDSPKKSPGDPNGVLTIKDGSAGKKDFKVFFYGGPDKNEYRHLVTRINALQPMERMFVTSVTEKCTENWNNSCHSWDLAKAVSDAEALSQLAGVSIVIQDNQLEIRGKYCCFKSELVSAAGSSPRGTLVIYGDGEEIIYEEEMSTGGEFNRLRRAQLVELISQMTLLEDRKALSGLIREITRNLHGDQIKPLVLKVGCDSKDGDFRLECSKGSALQEKESLQSQLAHKKEELEKSITAWNTVTMSDSNQYSTDQLYFSKESEFSNDSRLRNFDLFEAVRRVLDDLDHPCHQVVTQVVYNILEGKTPPPWHWVSNVHYLVESNSIPDQSKQKVLWEMDAPSGLTPKQAEEYLTTMKEQHIRELREAFQEEEKRINAKI